jgi:hypothetical protein
LGEKVCLIEKSRTSRLSDGIRLRKK